MSDDLHIIKGDPEDLDLGREANLGELERPLVLAWLAEHAVAAEGGVWAAAGVVAEVDLTEDRAGRIRAVDVAVHSGEPEAYAEDRAALEKALGELAVQLGARVWSVSEDRFIDEGTR